jgi:hypothetical protein
LPKAARFAVVCPEGWLITADKYADGATMPSTTPSTASARGQ